MAKLRTGLFSAALLGLVACGSGDDDGGAADVDDTSTATENTPADEQPDDGQAADDQPATGGGTGTLTLADDTVFALSMSTCETSETGADGFLIEDGFDLFGRTADGEFTVQLIRAGFDEDNIVDTGALEGEFDENGKNAELLYNEVHESLIATVDGGNVSGTVTLKPIGPNRPYGDEIDATFDINC